MAPFAERIHACRGWLALARLFLRRASAVEDGGNHRIPSEPAGDTVQLHSAASYRDRLTPPTQFANRLTSLRRKLRFPRPSSRPNPFPQHEVPMARTTKPWSEVRTHHAGRRCTSGSMTTLVMLRFVGEPRHASTYGESKSDHDQYDHRLVTRNACFQGICSRYDQNKKVGSKGPVFSRNTRDRGHARAWRSAADSTRAFLAFGVCRL